MGVGVYREKFKGRGDCIGISSLSCDTSEEAYREEMLTRLSEEFSDLCREELAALDKYDFRREVDRAVGLPSYEGWLSDMSDQHHEEISEVVNEAANELLGSESVRLLPSRTYGEADFMLLAQAKNSGLTFGIRGWQHDSIVGIYDEKALGSDLYYSKDTGQLWDETAERVLSKMLPAEMLQDLESERLDLARQYMVAKLQERFGSSEIYKCEGGWMASRFSEHDKESDIDAALLTIRDQFCQANEKLSNTRALFEGLSEQDTQTFYQEIKASFQDWSVKDWLHVAVVDTLNSNVVGINIADLLAGDKFDECDHFVLLDSIPSDESSLAEIQSLNLQGEQTRFIPISDNLGQTLNKLTREHLDQCDKAGGKYAYFISPNMAQKLGYEFDLKLLTPSPSTPSMSTGM